MSFSLSGTLSDMTGRRAAEACLFMILELLFSKGGLSAAKGGWLSKRKANMTPSPAGS